MTEVTGLDELDRLRAVLADRYRVDREIGRGGMATVYLAQDLKFDRQAAIKVLQPELASMVGAERFLREIQIGARLQHPNILPLHDSGEGDGIVYFVMPFVRGESLRARLNRERQLSLEDALSIAREIGDALSYAHGQGIVHRDIKPENILLSEGHAVLADFGVARAVSAASGKRVTKTGHILGTPPYMSPEQAAGESDVDTRSDIYALGCVLYEMLAGEPPFSGRTPQAIMAKHVLERTPSIQILRPSVPNSIAVALEKALEKQPVDRFKTARDFIAALEPRLEDRQYGPAGAAVEAPPPRVEEAGRPVRPDAPRPLRATKLSRGLWGTVAVTVILAALVGRSLLDRFVDTGDLVRNRVLVFPLFVTPEESADLGEDIATLVGYSLERTGQLSWVDGWYTLDEPQVAGWQSSQSRYRGKARAQRSAFYVLGRIFLRDDSVRVRLELHDVAGDSVLARGDAEGPRNDAWKQRETEKAVQPLIQALLPADKSIELAAWSDSTQAIDRFVVGERAYRRARFAEALEHYREAVAADSLFAMAAIKGARAALWLRDTDQATELVRAALTRESSLTSLQAHFAHGLEYYLKGQADSALTRFRLAFDIAPEWWILARIGEVYTHLLPRGSRLDSLAEAAFIEVHRQDPGLHPVLFHLIQISLRKGQVDRAERLFAQFRKAEPDSARLAEVELMLDCVKNPPETMDWEQAVLRDAGTVYDAAQSLIPGGFQAECAREAWMALLTYGSSVGPEAGYQFGALLNLQSLLVAEGHYEEAKRLLQASAETWGKYVEDVYVLNTVAGADMQEEAQPNVEEMRRRFRAGDRGNGILLWFLGTWEAHAGRGEEARIIADSLAALADANGRRLTRLWSASLAARAALASGDSTRALELLRELSPTKPFGAQAYPGELLAHEQVTLAELAYGRGEYAQAIDFASSLDAPARPATDLIYLPASLAIRLRAARVLGDRALEERCVRRLEALGREDLIQSAPSP